VFGERRRSRSSNSLEQHSNGVCVYMCTRSQLSVSVKVKEIVRERNLEFFKREKVRESASDSLDNHKGFCSTCLFQFVEWNSIPHKNDSDTIQYTYIGPVFAWRYNIRVPSSKPNIHTRTRQTHFDCLFFGVCVEEAEECE